MMPIRPKTSIACADDLPVAARPAPSPPEAFTAWCSRMATRATTAAHRNESHNKLHWPEVGIDQHPSREKPQRGSSPHCGIPGQTKNW
jgi:hypothetical protein